MGSFHIDKSVQVAKGLTASRTFVGYKIGGMRPTITHTVGRFGFASPISASVFSYLNNHPEVTQEAAILAVEGIETRLNLAGALNIMHGLNLGSAITAVIPYGKLVEVGCKVVTSFGDAAMKLKISSSSPEVACKNPYVPRENGTWTGNMTDEYADYAVAFWKHNQGWGPAYKLGA